MLLATSESVHDVFHTDREGWHVIFEQLPGLLRRYRHLLRGIALLQEVLECGP
jgi:hypothetical protein